MIADYIIKDLGGNKKTKLLFNLNKLINKDRNNIRT